MTKGFCAALDVYQDDVPQSAAMNMALDEALLETVKVPSLRLYRWDHPALSFGYFGRYRDVSSHERERDLVRRWTGGGIVFHGQDLTYSIIVPAHDPAFAKTSIEIYTIVHAALCNALIANGTPAELAAVAEVGDAGDGMTHRGFKHQDCFANPVRADVLLNGTKVAGAAQRRSRLGLLQQGSIQGVDLAHDFTEKFAKNLSANWSLDELQTAVIERAREISERKYATPGWLRKR